MTFESPFWTCSQASMSRSRLNHNLILGTLPPNRSASKIQNRPTIINALNLANNMPTYSAAYSTVMDDYNPRNELKNRNSGADFYEDLDFTPKINRNGQQALFDKTKQSASTVDSTGNTPPPLPPPLLKNVIQANNFVNSNHLKHKNDNCCSNFRLYLLITLLIFVSILIAAFIIASLWYTQTPSNSIYSTVHMQKPSNPSSIYSSNYQEAKKEFNDPKIPEKLVTENEKIIEVQQMDRLENDPLIEVSYLLTLLITQRKICLFEVSTSEIENSRNEFRQKHIPTARLLLFSSLAHNGVPVHPLQFQRYIRSLGVDSECHVIVYDRGAQIWATYAFWIFKLYGHSKISLLNGAFSAWETHLNTSHDHGAYKIESGAANSAFVEKLGNFRASWTSDFITTFDDVFANFESHEADIVDVQTYEEYKGIAKGNLIFGHIRSAINIPSETLYDWTNESWLTREATADLFKSKHLNSSKTIILYDGTSLHSTMAWFALNRLNSTYKATIYFGSWSEWIIRAPDYLKVIPNGE